MSKIDSSSLSYIIICLIGVAAFCLVGIYPNIQSMDELEENIADLTTQVQTQELLFPVYSRLIKEVQQQQPALPLPDNAKIKRAEIATINDVFRTIAEKNQVVFENAAPDASSYLEDSASLTMNVVFNGDFFNFQKVLLDVCQVPYLASIDHLSIQTDTDGKRLALTLQLNQE